MALVASKRNVAVQSVGSYRLGCESCLSIACHSTSQPFFVEVELLPSHVPCWCGDRGLFASLWSLLLLSSFGRNERNARYNLRQQEMVRHQPQEMTQSAQTAFLRRMFMNLQKSFLAELPSSTSEAVHVPSSYPPANAKKYFVWHPKKWCVKKGGKTSGLHQR